MSEDTMLNEAIEAVREGKRARARDLLTRLLRADSSNTEYWIWMSSVVESSKEQIYCLQSVLRLDPNHRAAKRGLILLGATEPDETILPVPPERRQRWEVKEIETPGASGIFALLANPVFRIALAIVLSVAVVGLMWAGISNFRERQRNEQLRAVIRLTLTAQPSPTLTIEPTLTSTPIFRSPTPTFARPTPLWMLLEATYTPTPLYVNTPHPSTEAYRAGIRAYERGQWNQVINFMEQVIDIEPDAYDAHYYIGEAYRFLEENAQALQAYNTALTINSAFAPAYLGRARARLALDPETDISADLEEAADLDPNYGEAFLARAAHLISVGESEAALDDLDVAALILPESALVSLHRAQALIEMGEYAQAVLAAEEANARDITLLPAYLAMGEAHLGSGNTRRAMADLQTYVLYVDEDAEGWLSLAQAQQAAGEVELALASYDRALDLDPALIDIYLRRGILYAELGDEERAIDDLLTARRFRPNAFEVNIELGKGYYTFERYGNAYIQFNETAGLADTDQELAVLYYWRALSLEQLDEPEAATRDWEALLALPADAAPPEWFILAEQHILALNPPTATPTDIPTITPIASNTPSPTLTPPPTASRTPFPTNTPRP